LKNRELPIKIDNKLFRLNFSYYFFVIIFILFYISLNAPPALHFLFNPDHGFQLSVAQQILNGLHPFIDLDAGVYGPLVFYVSALGQIISNYRLIGEIISIILGYSIAYFLLFFLILRLSKNRILSILLLIFMLFLMPRFYKYYIFLGPALIATMLYIYLYSQNRSSIIALAFSVAFIGMFRLDYGFYALTVSVTAIILKHTNPIVHIYRELIFLISLIILFIAPWIIFLEYNASLIDICYHLIQSSSRRAAGLTLPVPAFDLSTPPLSNNNLYSFQFWLFAIIPVMSIATLLYSWHSIEKTEKHFIFCITFLSIIIFCSQALHRSDYHHFLQAIPLHFVQVGWMITKALKIISKKKLCIKKFAGFTIVLLFILAGTSFLLYFSHTKQFQFKNKIVNMPEKVRHYFFSRAQLRKMFGYRLKHSP